MPGTPGFITPPAATDLYERLAQAVGGVITATAPGTIKRVFVSATVDDAVADYPCVFVTWDGSTEQYDMDFEGNLDGYPISVLLCDRQDIHDPLFRARYLGIRKTLMDTFRPLNGYDSVPECWNVEVNPQVVFDPKLPQYMHVVSGFTVINRCWEQRPKE